VTIRTRCPHCDEVLAFPDQREGQVEECASCTGGLRVPRLIRYRCPNCDHRFMSAPHHGGRRFPCLKCGQDVIVPQYVSAQVGADQGAEEPKTEDWGEDDAGASVTSDAWFDEASGAKKNPYGSSFDDDSSGSHTTLPPQFGAGAMAAPRTGAESLQTGGNSEYAPAGFGYRVLAYLLDVILLCFLSLPIHLLLGTFSINWTAITSPDEVEQAMSAFAGPVYQLLSWILPLAYMTILEASPLQATLGKLALGMRVEDERGERPGVGRILGRNVLKVITGPPCCFLLYVVAAFTANHQAVHDMIAGTYVTRRA